MAMVRSALARIPRRLSSAAATPSVMCRRGTEILQAPALPSLHRAAPLIPRPGLASQMMRTFTSPAAAPAASAVRIRGVSNLPGLESVISKGTRSMDQVEKKGAELIELARCTVGRLKTWLNAPSDPRYEFVAVAFISVVSVLSSAVTCHRIGSYRKGPGKSVTTGFQGKMNEVEEGLLPVWRSC